MDGKSDQQQLPGPDLLAATPGKASSDCSVQKSQPKKPSYRSSRPVSVSDVCGEELPTAAEFVDGETLPRVFESIRTYLSDNVVKFLGVQELSRLCDDLHLQLERKEGSDLFAVAGLLPELHVFKERTLEILKTNSSVVASTVMFGEDSVEEQVLPGMSFTCKPPEQTDFTIPQSSNAVERLFVGEAAQKPLSQTPGLYQMLSHPLPSREVSSNRPGSEDVLFSAEIFGVTQTVLSKQVVLFLGILQISRICETLRLKLFSHQTRSSFVVVGLYEDLHLLHQTVTQVVSDNSTRLSYACVFGRQDCKRHAPGMASFAPDDEDSQPEEEGQAAGSQASVGVSRSHQDKTTNIQDRDMVQSSSTSSVSSIRRSETVQVNKLTIDLVEITAKKNLTRIEKECKVKIRKDDTSDPTAALLSLEGTSEDCDLSRGLELLKEACFDVSRQDIKDAKIKIEGQANVAAITSMKFEDMRVIGKFENGNCVIYGLSKDVEAAEKKIRMVLQTSGRSESGISSGIFALQSGQAVIVKKGNIVQEKVDVIVNAANDRLEHSAGVAGAICRAAGGSSFQEECRSLVRKFGPIREGEAVFTSAGSLPFKRIVHTVAPRWSSFKSDQTQRVAVLKKACFNSLSVTDENGGTSVAIPGLGSGIYGIPKPVCAQALLDGAEEFFKKKRSSRIQRVVFIDLDDSAVAAFMAEAVQRYGKGISQGGSDPAKQDQERKEHGSGALAQVARAARSLFSSFGSVERDPCSICFDQLPDTKLKCGHEFCKTCIDHWAKTKPTCPICSRPFGKVEGNQPKTARMDVVVTRTSLPGYNGVDTIVITYRVPSGIQGNEHPNPGRQFTGTTRTAYLPNTKEGKELLSLLQKAFQARLVFTIGRSVTSGQDNVVTWNDIHHKTSMYGGQQSYGYPDQTYLDRLRADLKVKGIE